jgi:NOL1/NOP2/fmu family ribosome biogenesis protein
MAQLDILNKKKVKEILKLIKKQWDADFNADLVFLMNEKGKIFLVNKEVFNLPLDKYKVNSIGLYFGELRNNELRLSIDGSQMIGDKAKKNIIELNKRQAMHWLKGQDIKTNKEYDGFVILKHENDFLGTGKYKNEKILNFVPKARRFKYDLEV